MNAPDMVRLARERDHIPQWEDAPEWARYLTRDQNGEWFWWEVEPQPYPASEVYGSVGMWDDMMGKRKPAYAREKWTSAIETRPKGE